MPKTSHRNIEKKTTAASEAELRLLNRYNIGLPLAQARLGITSSSVKTYLKLQEIEAFQSKRACRRCSSFVLVVPAQHPAFAQYWGDFLAEDTPDFLCVKCYSRGLFPPGSKAPPASKPIHVKVVSPTDPTEEFSGPNLPDFIPPDPEVAPVVVVQPPVLQGQTLRYFTHFISRQDSWLTAESICDLLRNQIVVFYRKGEARRVHPQDFNDLPRFGTDLEQTLAVHDAEELLLLVQHYINILEHQGTISVAADGSLKILERRNFELQPVVSLISSVLPETYDTPFRVPTEQNPLHITLSDLKPDLIKCYTHAISTVRAQYPEQADNGWAVRVRVMGIILGSEMEWNEQYFELARQS